MNAEPDAEAIFAHQQAEAFDDLRSRCADMFRARSVLKQMRDLMPSLEEAALSAQDKAESLASALVSAGLITDEIVMDINDGRRCCIVPSNGIAIVLEVV